MVGDDRVKFGTWGMFGRRRSTALPGGRELTTDDADDTDGEAGLAEDIWDAVECVPVLPPFVGRTFG